MHPQTRTPQLVQILHVCSSDYGVPVPITLNPLKYGKDAWQIGYTSEATMYIYIYTWLMLGYSVPYQLAEVDSRSVLPGLACLSLPAMAIIKGSLHKHPQDYTQCCKSCAKQREFLNVICALAHQAPMLQSQLAADLNKKPFKFNGLFWISILHEEYKFKWIQVEH